MGAFAAITIALMAAKMAINLGVGAGGLRDAKAALKQARRDATVLTTLHAMRASATVDNTRDLIGAQSAAVAHAGLASSSAAEAAGREALRKQYAEIHADEMQTRQRINSMLRDAKAGVKTARSALATGLVGDAADLTATTYNAVDKDKHTQEGRTKIPTTSVT